MKAIDSPERVTRVMHWPDGWLRVAYACGHEMLVVGTVRKGKWRASTASPLVQATAEAINRHPVTDADMILLRDVPSCEGCSGAGHPLVRSPAKPASARAGDDDPYVVRVPNPYLRGGFRGGLWMVQYRFDDGTTCLVVRKDDDARAKALHHNVPTWPGTLTWFGARAAASTELGIPPGRLDAVRSETVDKVFEVALLRRDLKLVGEATPCAK